MICKCMNVYFVSCRWLCSDGQAYKMTLPWLKKLLPESHKHIGTGITVLSEVFSSDSNRVDLKGRECRERLARLIEKN